jgi:hypothetical protein
MLDLETLTGELDKWRSTKDLDLTKREARLINLMPEDNPMEKLGKLVKI